MLSSRRFLVSAYISQSYCNCALHTTLCTNQQLGSTARTMSDCNIFSCRQQLGPLSPLAQGKVCSLRVQRSLCLQEVLPQGNNLSLQVRDLPLFLCCLQSQAPCVCWCHCMCRIGLGSFTIKLLAKPKYFSLRLESWSANAVKPGHPLSRVVF